jgi:hypothetical protein
MNQSNNNNNKIKAKYQNIWRLQIAMKNGGSFRVHESHAFGNVRGDFDAEFPIERFRRGKKVIERSFGDAFHDNTEGIHAESKQVHNIFVG